MSSSQAYVALAILECVFHGSVQSREPEKVLLDRISLLFSSLPYQMYVRPSTTPFSAPEPPTFWGSGGLAHGLSRFFDLFIGAEPCALSWSNCRPIRTLSLFKRPG